MGTRPSPAERESLPGEPVPAELTPEQSRRDRTRRERARRKRGERTSCSSVRRGAARRRSISRPAKRRSCAGSGRSCSCRRSRSPRRRSVAFASASATRSRSCTRPSAQAERRDERDRIARGEARVVVGARSAIFAPMRDLGLVIVRRGARLRPTSRSPTRATTPARVAAKRAALEGAVARLRERDAAARELGDARAGRSRPRGSGLRCRACGSSISAARAGYPLSAPLLDRARPGRRAGRQGDPAPQPARRRRRRSTAGPAACRAAAGTATSR